MANEFINKTFDHLVGGLREDEYYDADITENVKKVLRTLSSPPYALLLTTLNVGMVDQETANINGLGNNIFCSVFNDEVSVDKCVMRKGVPIHYNTDIPQDRIEEEFIQTLEFARSADPHPP